MTFTATPGGTRVVWTTTSEVRLPGLAGPVTRLLATPLVTRVFGQILDKCAEDLAAAPMG